MTNIQNHVTSLELSKRLRELGVKQKLYPWETNPNLSVPASCFLYIHPWQKTRAVVNKSKWIVSDGSNLNGRDYICAFLSSELGEMLDKALRNDVLKAYAHVFGAIDTNVITPMGMVLTLTKPNLAAQMLIYLIENNLIPINNVNN